MYQKMFTLAAAALTLTFTACNSGGEKKESADTPAAQQPAPAPAPAEAAKDVVDLAIASPDHTTLVTAVQAADLAATLKGAGPFTIFAPTNAAFDKLPKGTVEGLLKPEKKADLANILTFHVVSGNVKAADLKDGQKVKTLQGGELTVSIKDGKVMIDGANVTTADLSGSNGVIHVIDAVLLPKK